MGSIQVTSNLIDAVRQELYPPPHWLGATEVQFHIPGGKRFADLVAVQLVGKGHEVHGFEAKVSRSDWLHEVNSPDKADAAKTQCDKWWLLAGSEEIYKEEEVPADWGIIAPGPNGLRVVRPAKYLHPRTQTPEPWDRHFMAAFLARAHADAEHSAGLLTRTARDAERKGFQKGRNAAARNRPTTNRPGPVKMKYDPGRYNFDDGTPLDLP